MTDTAKFDFGKIEQLRSHMLLRQSDMAELFGVSRVQYNKWVQKFSSGETPELRGATRTRVRDMLTKLVRVVQVNEWPQHGIAERPANVRMLVLKSLLDRDAIDI